MKAKDRIMREYQVLQGNTPEGIALRVTAALANDWVLYLGLQVAINKEQIVFAQAMTKVFSAPFVTESNK